MRFSTVVVLSVPLADVVDGDIDIPESVVSDEEAVSLFSLFNNICIISTAVIVFPPKNKGMTIIL